MVSKPAFKVTVDFLGEGQSLTATREFIASPEILAAGLSRAITDAALECHFDITAQKIKNERSPHGKR